MDARGYGAADGRRQIAIQRGLVDLLDDSAEAAGLRRSAWERQKAGDGEFAVLPADEPESVLIDGFVRALADRVADYNEDRRDEARMRLRLAIHNGIVEPAANGYAGAGAVVVGRLCDAAPAKALQDALPEAGLVVILSNRVFLDTVAQGHTALRPTRFRKVRVRVKEYQDDAWLHVPDLDIRAVDLGDGTRPESPPPPPGPPGPPGPPASVVNNFYGETAAEVIGVQVRHHG
ncbi:hypothetical protein ACTOB_008578 [Actinoplanes oblitus]|uniref:Uncharacterized protein n=1 Tax=Actinoplanes oblitus TaxID=3040509 RepID=A0ABY8WEV6_9ACTN|nr:hypothetical protein [Actinoplanes oblitus]WIM96386.1 hypothetical protein ACTOB_008578 [Actinoplanes oblitus]